MIYRGRVKNGVVVLDDAVTLPEGTEVRVDVSDDSQESTGDADAPTLYERLEPLIGTAKGLPPDASKNVDHYLYGHPKQ